MCVCLKADTVTASLLLLLLLLLRLVADDRFVTGSS